MFVLQLYKCDSFLLKLDQMKKIKLLSISFLVLIFTNSIVAQPNYPRDSKDAELVYTDLENFVEAFSFLK